jgi:hypothetical protein
MRIVVLVNSGFPQAKGISPKIIRNLSTRSQNFVHIVVRWKDLKNIGFKRRQVISPPIGANMSRTGPDLPYVSGLSSAVYIWNYIRLLRSLVEIRQL